MLVAFILLSLQLLREQIVQADELKKPFQTSDGGVTHDPRQDPFANQRGNILDNTGKIAVGSQVNKDGEAKRTYPNADIAPLVGYYNPIKYGLSGLEESYNQYLTGEQGSNPLLKLQKDLLHETIPGNNIILTIDPTLQSSAVKALGSANGAIVLLDAQSGAVLAMTGNPHYDPSKLLYDPTLQGDQLTQANAAVDKYWQQLNNDKNAPLLLRPTQGLYTPGSIFKTITLGAAIDTGGTSLDSTWNDTGKFTINSYTINDPNRPDTSKTTWTSEEGYMFSLNAVFAQMGLKVGADNFMRYTNQFGFGQQIPFDLPVEPSLLYSNNSDSATNFKQSQTALASTGFGQGELQTTPLEMALVAAAIGRGDGALPKPYLVKEVRNQPTSTDPQGALVMETKPSIWLQALRPDTAKLVQAAMKASATTGWVGLNKGNLAGSGAVVGGKTGTAELGNNIENAWYIAWATKGNRTFAIACVVDHLPGGEGLRDAMPRANTVLLAALATVK
jgi:peptidoglycan glycosyltransferase